MKSIIKSIIVAGVLLLIPMASFAATYQYVNTTGSVQTENATSPEQAILLASNAEPTSGVIMASSDPVSPADPSGTYQYVNVAGDVEAEQAASPSAALTLPANIAPTSGVIAVTSTTVIPASVSVPVQP